jgi:CubicO group peptidase (beta-lactamase class C family)
MATARIADDPRPFSDDFATGYGPDLVEGLAVEPWGPEGSFAPAGGTLASLTDMAAFVTLQLRGGTTSAGRRVVSAQNLAECWQPVIAAPIEPAVSPAVRDGAYCMGWMSTHFAGRRVLSHGGVVDGFICNMAFLPDDGVGLVVLTNTFAGGSVFCAFALNLLLEQRFGPAADTNAALVSEYQVGMGQLTDLAAQAMPVDPAAIAPFLGYYDEGFRLAFDAEGTLQRQLQPRAWRVLGQPDGSYVIGSGVPVGNALRFSRDAVGVPQMELEDFTTVRWQSGLG